MQHGLHAVNVYYVYNVGFWLHPGSLKLVKAEMQWTTQMFITCQQQIFNVMQFTDQKL